MAIETVPITENLYSLAMALMREGLEIESPDVRWILSAMLSSIARMDEHGD